MNLFFPKNILSILFILYDSMPSGISDISLSSDISSRDKLMNKIKHF